MLADTGARVAENDRILSTVDTTPKRLETGHSCYIRAEVRRAELTLTNLRETDLVLHFRELSDTMVLLVEVPVRYAVQLLIKEEYGFRLFGRCMPYRSIWYTLNGVADTTANLAVAINLNSQARATQGDNDDLYTVSVKPEVAVLSSISNTNVNLQWSKHEPAAQIMQAATDLSVGLALDLTEVLHGETVAEIIDELRNDGNSDTDTPFVLHRDAIDSHVGIFDQLDNLFADLTKWQANKAVYGIESTLENTVSTAEKNALGTDTAGYRVIPVDFSGTSPRALSFSTLL